MVQTLINTGTKVNACNAECEGAPLLHPAIEEGNENNNNSLNPDVI